MIRVPFDTAWAISRPFSLSRSSAVVSAVVFGAFDLRFVDPDEFDLEFPRHRRLAHSKRSSFKMTALSYLVDDEIDIQIKAAFHLLGPSGR